ncbi:hypothetical protein [Tateyamaria pelophila]
MFIFVSSIRDYVVRQVFEALQAQ